MTEKLRDCFDEMVVYKDLKKSNFFSALGLPSFLRDWLLKKFADDEGNLVDCCLNQFLTGCLIHRAYYVRSTSCHFIRKVALYQICTKCKCRNTRIVI